MPAVRLTLICHAATAGARAATFPADEPLSDRGLRDTKRLAAMPLRADRAFTSPAPAARATAAALGLPAVEVPALGELDYGRWRGRTLAEIEADDPEGLAAWLSDPGSAPHGGESVARLCTRVGAWMDEALSRRGRLVAVTHASAIRAAVCHVLQAPPSAFWRIDVAPLALAEFRGNGDRWTLRRLGSREDRPPRDHA